MHVQAHMSGQISGQLPNQAGTQLPGLPQQNGGTLPSQVQTLGGFQGSWHADPDVIAVRNCMQERILHFLQRQQKAPNWQPKLPDLVKRLESGLFKDAPSKDEYVDLDTLERRIQVILEKHSNRNQQLVHPVTSSSSFGTMIPTPGLSQNSNTSPALPSSMDNQGMANMGSNSMVPNTVGMGNMLPMTNGPVGIGHGTSFNVSDGPVHNGYQQTLGNIGSGNNLVSSMGIQRLGSQMIPTPGLNNQQSISVNPAGSSGGGFSSMEPIMMPHQQPPKPYIGSQTNRMHNLSGQIGIGLRSGMQQKPSYGFPNGALNGGLPLVGNNMHLMNGTGPSDDYLSSSIFGNSQKPPQQQFERQRQQQLMQSESFAMNAADLSATGNLYGPTTSMGPAATNQNMNSLGLQSKLKTHSALQSHQTNLQTLQQASHTKSQQFDHMAKMNFQPPQMTRDHVLQSQQPLQKYQQPQFQQLSHQAYQQFSQHQHEQKQQNQHHQQVLIKNEAMRQTPPQSNLGGQMMGEQGMEPHDDGILQQISDQYQLTETQNQYQQVSAAEDHSKGSQILSHNSSPQELRSQLSQPSHQMQQTLHPHQQINQQQNEFSSVAIGSQAESLLHGQWHVPTADNSQATDQSSLEKHVQEDFRQRLMVLDEAQRPHLLQEGSMGARVNSSKGAPMLEAPIGASRGSGNRNSELRGQQFHKQTKWLLFLFHASKCKAPHGTCLSRECVIGQQLLVHIAKCHEAQCGYPRCRESKGLLWHKRNCRDADCPVCIPFRQMILRHKALNRAPSESGPSNAKNGTWKTVNAADATRTTTKSISSTFEASEELQSSLKRVKMEHLSPSAPLIKSEPQVFVPPISQTPVQFDETPQVCHVAEDSRNVKVEGVVMKMESSVVAARVGLERCVEDKKAELGQPAAAMAEVVCSTTSEVVIQTKQEHQPDQMETEPIKSDVKPETAVAPIDNAAAGKMGKPKIKGVSLTELFTPEQVREHIIGLRQWVGQSKAKAEKNQAMENSMSENSCQLCAVEKLTFEPPPIYCTPCGARIRRNALYYTFGTGDTRHYFCIPCYNEVRGEYIEVDCTNIPKAKLEKKRNDEETEEAWVQCDKCEAWQHQICALFNGRRNDGGQAEYTCPNCYISEIERGERKPLPQSAVLGAKDLPRTILSDHMEQRLFRRLKQERQERAKHLGKSYDEVPGAEALVIRVVSSVDKKLEVKQRFLEIFQEQNYPSEFPYKSKVILLFQRIEGVEVCLFGMYVQEFGSECQLPNQRRVYLSYLDSVKYFRPETRTVTGEALRTFVYHEILIGYLEYCKKRGFTSCYIWACPPLKGEDYILYCHPEIQKTPKSDKLREWYLSMLRKAAKEDIVVDLTNLHDHFFVALNESKAKVTAARLPYFDGDYWPGAAEDMINQLRQEEDGRKQQKKGKTKKTITKRALKAAAQADLSSNASKDAVLMEKLGDTIQPMKEDFIMVHLQHACTHCCHLMVSGKRWVCNQCRNFQLCDRCYDAEQKLEEKDRHPINNSREKHVLSPVEINDVPADTKDKDEILESEFFDTRQAFLSLCQGNHYQYDTLRRAKHSSMMILYHLHNPTEPAFVTTCNICQHDIEAGQGWRCEVCPDYDVCNACYQKQGAVDHPHKLTTHPSLADRDAQNKEARQKRVLQLRRMLDLLVHASQCRSPHCQYPHCRKVKGLFRHGIQCKVRASGGCVLCKKMWYLLQLHARACKESECHVPRCRDLKEHLRRLQQQSDSRRRAAVMEMMRQRAAEVAGGAG
ncbi:histone acetyltransferase HAC1 [Amborella trichopoda]|uniref:histone acetyltransferase n=1 Tax=Amborella trichopoda TaxID=13333 RepID=W1P8F1_AMBTC|nr:histone acetyltransferase HAC1 [Amborella trichopoda]ERN03959.1 hypothetical protein AMTR_s00079p00078710 [Amborella trichopoda]|eukprot:XP_006842284.1 histone acetyltransferase HAC1 [Amborella trichopoda]